MCAVACVTGSKFFILIASGLRSGQAAKQLRRSAPSSLAVWMETGTLDAGDRAFVALRAYDSGARGVTTRSGSCTILHLDPPHALVAAPAELGTSEGNCSDADLKNCCEQRVSMHVVKLAALRQTIEGLESIHDWVTRPKFFDLQKLAEDFGREAPSTDAEAYQPSCEARPRQSNTVARKAEDRDPWKTVEALMGKKKSAISFNTDS